MKSILIIDTPTRCFDCPLFTDDEDDCHYGFCDNRNILKQKEAQEKVRFNEKPTWCPLRPLSSFKAVDLNDTRDVVMFCHGWNTCLAEVTGETE